MHGKHNNVRTTPKDGEARDASIDARTSCDVIAVFFQIRSGTVGLSRGSFVFMTDKVIIVRNRQRTPPEYREYLTRIVRSSFKEGMANDEWALSVGYLWRGPSQGAA